MNLKPIRMGLLCLASLVVAKSPALPQGGEAAANPNHASLLFHGLPDIVQPQIAALGDRVQQSGRENTILTGRLTDFAGTTFEAQLLLQLSGAMELRDSRKGRSPLKFDRAATSTGFDPADAALLESFSTDTAEGMLRSLRNGASLMILGHNVLPAEEPAGDRSARYDIYAVTDAVHTRRDGVVRTKFYCFDAKTSFLARTTYSEGRVEIETRFSNWIEQDGSAYPRRIERFENGHSAFSFVADNILAGPMTDPAAFR